MTTKVQRWGNSLALRIPKSFAKDVHLEKGATVNLTIDDGRLVIEPSSKSRYSLAGLLKNISENNLHKEVDTGGRQGREIW